MMDPCGGWQGERPNPAIQRTCKQRRFACCLQAADRYRWAACWASRVLARFALVTDVVSHVTCLR